MHADQQLQGDVAHLRILTQGDQHVLGGVEVVDRVVQVAEREQGFGELQPVQGARLSPLGQFCEVGGP